MHQELDERMLMDIDDDCQSFDEVLSNRQMVQKKLPSIISMLQYNESGSKLAVTCKPGHIFVYHSLQVRESKELMSTNALVKLFWLHPHLGQPQGQRENVCDKLFARGDRVRTIWQEHN